MDQRASEITVRFFASLRERLGTDQVRVESHGIATIADLQGCLSKRGEHWLKALGDQQTLAAVNQAMAKPSTPVKPGDEVAFFPPVTGG